MSKSSSFPAWLAGSVRWKDVANRPLQVPHVYPENLRDDVAVRRPTRSTTHPSNRSVRRLRWNIDGWAFPESEREMHSFETPPTTSEGTVGVAAAQGTTERPSAGVRPALTAKRSTVGPAMRLALAQKLYQADVERSRTTTAAGGRSAKPAPASFGPRAKQQRNQQGRSGSVKSRPATTKKCAALRGTSSSATTTQPSAAPEPRRRSHRLLAKH
jgi:hypothetical protein